MTTSEEGAERTQYLTFSVAGEEHGLPVLKVREILEYGTLTRVPRTPEYVRGVINLRGRVVPVVDLAVRFGLAPSGVTSRTCVVIVELEMAGEPVVMGIMADAVSQVVDLGADEIEPPPSFGTRVDVAYLKGMGRCGRGFVLLLDVDRLLSAEETDRVAALADGGEAGSGDVASGDVASGSTGAASAVASALLALVLLAVPAVRAQEEPISDNSFLIEEAYNQERGVVQHINAFSRVTSSGDWLYTFTQEWPLPDEKHQVSYTLPVQDLHGGLASATGIGDLALNYRYQLMGGAGPVAFAPRLSLLVPTGQSRRGLGTGGVGLQMNLPLSWACGSRVVTHWNAGYTHTYAARDGAGEQAGTNAWNLGQSVVWLAHPRFNLLVETAYVRGQAVVGEGTVAASNALYLNPGIRWSFNFKSGLQIVPGVAFPIGIGPSQGEHGVFLYLSLEHPFRRASKTSASASTASATP